MSVTQSLTITQVSQNIASNTSQVRLLWTSTQSNGSYNLTTKTAEYTFNGVKYSVSYNLPANTTKTIVDRIFTVNHNSDGTKTVTASSTMNTGISAGTVTKTASKTLTTIPRASTLSHPTEANIGSNITIKINPKATGFTHTVSYSLDNKATWTVIGSAKRTDTSFSWTLPTSIYSLMPNSKYYTVYFTVQTYSGNTQIGSQQLSNIKTWAVEADCKPVVAVISTQELNDAAAALTGGTKYIKNISNVKVLGSVLPQNSATIKSQTVTCGAIGKDFPLSGITYIDKIQSGQITLSATDSRGYSNTATVNLDIIDYYEPTCEIVVQPPDSATGVSHVELSGRYWNGSFGAKTNGKNVYVRYKISGASAWTTVEVTPTLADGGYTVSTDITGLDYRQVYTFQGMIADKLHTGNNAVKSPSITVNTRPIFDWGENDFNFNVPVNFGSGFTTDSAITIGEVQQPYVVEQGTSGIWTYIKMSDGNAICWGYTQVSSAFETTWGSVFTHTASERIDYPFTFKSFPREFVTHKSNGGACWMIVESGGAGANSTTQTARYNCVRPDKATNTTKITYNFLVIGKWR